MNESISQTEFKALEKLFDAEVHGNNDQSTEKIYEELEQKGYAKKFHKTLILDDKVRIEINGYILTSLGRSKYLEAFVPSNQTK